MKMNFNSQEERFQSLAKTIFATGLIFLMTAWLSSATAQEKSVAEEILDILKDQGQITDQQYEDLKKKAEEEKVEKEAKGTDFNVYWKNGLKFDSKDGNFKLQAGGRIQLDFGSIDPDSSLERSFPDLKGTGVEFRRARLFFSGTVYDSVFFKAQYDFAGQDADFKDVYLGLQKIPVIGHLRIGHQKEPFSLEELTSSKYITFLERALPVAAFAPGRNTGIAAYNPVLDKRMTWAVGIYQETNDSGDAFNDFDDFNLTLRLTGLPWYAEGGRKLLHLGFGYNRRFRDEDESGAQVRFRTRPETHITDERLVDTGIISADNVDQINPEAAFVYGPFSVQGEYFWNKVDSKEADDPEFQGAYVYGSWFVTGENRRYSTSSGAFSRVSPKKNFYPTKGGAGAWELTARWSYIDLNDKNIRGGEENNLTAGVNWYLNPNVRFMFNYIYADLEDREGKEDGNANIFMTRFQIDF
jgi:phosphate-selective porin OprO/OprP